MELSRRLFLQGVAGAAALAGLDGLAARSAFAHPRPSVAGTTLDRVIVRGTAGPGGYAALTTGPGEPFVFRGELAGVGSHEAARGRVLACFAQLTDVHVMDVQSPSRVEFLDPFVPFVPDFGSAYRPQE